MQSLHRNSLIQDGEMAGSGVYLSRCSSKTPSGSLSFSPYLRIVYHKGTLGYISEDSLGQRKGAGFYRRILAKTHT